VNYPDFLFMAVMTAMSAALCFFVLLCPVALILEWRRNRNARIATQR
jgi:hypothetical protein